MLRMHPGILRSTQVGIRQEKIGKELRRWTLVHDTGSWVKNAVLNFRLMALLISRVLWDPDSYY